MRLPIDPLIPGILRHLGPEGTAAPQLVLQAPPGAGKTTRVPPALLELSGGDVLVLEPRRLAARLAARFVAAQLGEPVGATVGYQVRFEEMAGPTTRLRFLTEGVLTRRLLSDPALEGVDTVVLDEFHERHLEGDLALALLRRLQRAHRPDLRLVVMSATLDPAPIAEYLGGAPVVRSEGRQHPLEIEYTPHSAAPLEQQIAAALEHLAARGAARGGASGLPGHVLVFLPGAAEIRRAQSACAALAQRHGWLALALHGDQSPEEQDQAVAPSQRTKIVFSTNVAESSITIEGVAAVVDSGLARVAGHSPWSGLPTLEVARISQASANQRAGRAGRTGPGRAIRLYPLEDFVRRPAQDTPEIARADLAPVALLLDAMGFSSKGAGGIAGLDWLDAPPAAHIAHAEALLRDLGATGATAREMARYPLHPRLARLIVEARRRGVAEDGCTVAALLSAGARLPERPERASHATRSDLLVLLESQWDGHTAQTVRQIRRMVNPPGQKGTPRSRDTPRSHDTPPSHDTPRSREDALLVSVLAAFPDRVARRRQGLEVQFAGPIGHPEGRPGSAQLAPSSTVTEAPFLVAVEAEGRDRKMPLIRIASAIEPDWLLDLFPERVRETSEVVWNRAAGRVEAVSALMFGQIAIQESRGAASPEEAAALLAAKAVEAGIERFADPQELEGFLARVAFAARHSAIPEMGTEAVEAALRSLAAGLKSFSELEAAARGPGGRPGLLRALEGQLSPAARQELEAVAPERIRLPGGRQVRVHYERSKPPWIASRLQDFFGLQQSPAVARGKEPLVIHLLAPNQRPVQMTTDLAGFWERLYPQVRRELSRRYPKHPWPEDPRG
ncbi:MAG: ATP-dependent helicase HrpB [Bryobacteraceae bacterium]